MLEYEEVTTYVEKAMRSRLSAITELAGPEQVLLETEGATNFNAGPGVLLARATALIDRAQYAEAQALLKGVISVTADADGGLGLGYHVEAWSELGILYKRLEQYDHAIDAFTQAGKLGNTPESSRKAVINITGTCIGRGDLASARRWVARLLTVNPSDAEALSGLREIEFRSGDFKRGN